MTKLAKISAILFSAAAATITGTGIGFYVHQRTAHNNNQSLRSEEYLQDIYEKISTLPGNTGSTWDDFHTFEQDVLAQIETSHINVKETITDILEDELDKIVKNTKDELNSSNSKIAFIGDQLEQYNDDVADALDTLDDGVVGSHDLNFYADIISTKVDKTILASSEEELNKKIADAGDRVLEIQETLTNDLSEKHQEITVELLGIQTDFDSQVTNTTNEIDTLKTDLAALNVSSNQTFDSLNKNLDDFKVDVAAIKTEFEAKQDAVNDALTNNLLRFSDLQSLFEAMIGEVQALNDLIITNENKFNLAIDIIKSDQATTALDLTNIRTSISNIAADAATTQTNISTLNANIESMNQLILNNDEEIRILKENLAGLDDELSLGLSSISDRLLTNTSQYLSNKAAIDDLAIKFDSVKEKVESNKDLIIQNGQAIDIASDNIANILFDMDQIVINATQSEAKIYEVEAMLENYQATNGGSIISEYETVYSDLPNDILTKRIYLAHPLGDYAELFVTVRLHHEYTLPQTMIIAPEQGKKSAVQWFRGNGAVNGILASLLFILDYDDNSIRTTAIQFHGVSAWFNGTYSNIRGILSK